MTALPAKADIWQRDAERWRRRAQELKRDKDYLITEVTQLRAQVKAIGDNAWTARSALGAKDCAEQPCEGCEVDTEDARGYLDAALAAYGKPYAPRHTQEQP